MNTARVTSKGRLVVPSRIRRRFGIKPVTREYIDSFCGIFKLKPGERSVVQEHLEERRAEREKGGGPLATGSRFVGVHRSPLRAAARTK